ncbi:uncharacterized protein LOC108683073 [Hyalella azteca]|uniref:Uncharacterized protein LOC108683073 n=1 Tax=Hyalella azteca TaxID=294128 RepID=A0A8B7PQT7_HYAAZ|nr:uncharacterized protein LOC108683073 [Hyalella azteca]
MASERINVRTDIIKPLCDDELSVQEEEAGKSYHDAQGNQYQEVVITSEEDMDVIEPQVDGFICVEGGHMVVEASLLQEDDSNEQDIHTSNFSGSNYGNGRETINSIAVPEPHIVHGSEALVEPTFFIDNPATTLRYTRTVMSAQKKAKRGQDMLCQSCHTTFKGRTELLKHQRTMHPNMASGTVKCQEIRCDFVCFRVNQLRDHLTRVHQLQIIEEELEFADEAEFVTWKEEYETHANCQYRLASTKVKAFLRYYSCSRSGYYVKKNDATRRAKLKGTSKLNAHCVAGLIVRGLEDGKLSVMHTKTHYGHDLEATHLRISKSQRSYIIVLYESGIPIKEIIKKVNSMESAEHNFILGRKDVVNVIASFQSKKLDSDFSVTSPYSVWNVYNVALRLKGNILFHKAKGEHSREAPTLKNSDFMLCIMSEFQERRLKNLSNQGVALHIASDMKLVDGLVIISLYTFTRTASNKPIDLPLATCVCNAFHIDILRVFLDAIKQKCGQLDVNYVISEENSNEVYGVWCEVFQRTPLQVIAPWFIQDSLWTALETFVIGQRTRWTLKTAVNDLFSETDAWEFSKKLQTFVLQKDEMPSCQRFISEYFIPTFMSAGVTGFAAFHHRNFSSDIKLLGETTLPLREKMLQSCTKSVSRAVADVLRYAQARSHSLPENSAFHITKSGGNMFAKKTDEPDVQAKRDAVKCLLTTLIGMLDDDNLPLDYEDAMSRLDRVESLIQRTPPGDDVRRDPMRRTNMSQITVNNNIPDQTNFRNCVRVKERKRVMKLTT